MRATSLRYLGEKLFSATLSMARDTGTLQQRLANAYLGSLRNLKPADFPADLQRPFMHIVNSLSGSRFPVTDEAVFAATAQLDDEQAGKVIEQIVSLYDDVAKAIA